MNSDYNFTAEILKFSKLKVSRELPMPDGSMRPFVMTNWHWVMFDMMVELFGFRYGRTVQRALVLAMDDWEDPSPDNRLSKMIAGVYHHGLKHEIKDKLEAKSKFNREIELLKRKHGRS